MPTGYTADIANDIDFEQFVLRCARAFGACVHQMDDKATDKPTLRNKKTYYGEKIEELSAKRLELEAMKPQDRVEYGEQLRTKELEWQQKFFNDMILLKNKYEDMLAKVMDWNPPTRHHTELKSFMIKQIQDSIRIDCDTSYTLERITQLSQERPINLFNKELEQVNRNLAYYAEEEDKDSKSVEESNAWIIDLYKSLGIEYK